MGGKVITSEEMERLESVAMEKGLSQEQLMRQAGKAIATHLDHWICQKKLEKTITLLAGKGNNGGDGFVAAIELLKKGYQIFALHLFDLKECRPLCRQFAEQFSESGTYTQVEQLKGSFFPQEGVILDALLGSGIRGPVSKPIQEAIQVANESSLPTIALDLPSGLDGTTGEIHTCAIEADLTLTLGFAKRGFFIREGWNCIGELQVVDFGLPAECVEDARAVAVLPSDSTLRSLLPKIVRNRHKYERGLVVGYAGSVGMTGAAKLSSLAALRAGAGIVKLFVPSPAAFEEMKDRPYEVICHVWDESFSAQLDKAGSVFIGPGLALEPSIGEWIAKKVPKLDCPCVLDGGAFSFLEKIRLPPLSLLTPHRGEVSHLLGTSVVEEEALQEMCQKFCEEKEVILILKGAPSYIFSAQSDPVIITHGDPAMATAGTGDVLTGILASLLAQGVLPFSAAILGTSLHAIAGEIAAEKYTSHACIASDLISSLSDAFHRLMEHSTCGRSNTIQ